VRKTNGTGLDPLDRRHRDVGDLGQFALGHLPCSTGSADHPVRPDGLHRRSSSGLNRLHRSILAS